MTNETHKPDFKLEYMTYPVRKLHPEDEMFEHGFVYPVPVHNLPGSLRERGRAKSKYAPYGLDDLTVGSYLWLADTLSGGKKKSLRTRFRKYMYMEEG